MIAFDIETLDIRSSAIVLSVGCVRFSLDDPETKYKGWALNDVYKDYLSKAIFVKFKAEEQHREKRTMDNNVISWWKEQNPLIREKSFMINPEKDQSAKAGIAQILAYCRQGDPEPTVWQRGGMDQIVYEDFSKQFGMDILPFWTWMDVRTAISLTKETAVRGYCEVPGFDRQLVLKHDPVHDVAYDIMMLVYGK